MSAEESAAAGATEAAKASEPTEASEPAEATERAEAAKRAEAAGEDDGTAEGNAPMACEDDGPKSGEDRPERVRAWTWWPSARRRSATGCQTHAPSHAPGISTKVLMARTLNQGSDILPARSEATAQRSRHAVKPPRSEAGAQ